MKKAILLMTACILFCLAGCMAKPDGPKEDVTETPTATPEPTKEEQKMTEKPEPTVTNTPTPTPALTDENGMYYKCPSEYLSKREGVTYGSFKRETYYSDYCKRERYYTVLLPADYSENKKYPVVYLLHGIFGDETSFAKDAKIPVLIGNMVADGLTREFILVCPAMYAAGEGTAQAPAFDAEACLPYDRFPTELVQCLMPHINKTYSVIEGREGTYIGGFSMGGRETLYTLMLYPELFKYVCAMAPAPGMTPAKDYLMEHPGSLKEEEVVFAEGTVLPEKIIINCGTRDSVVGKFPLGYHDLFTKNGIEHLWYEVPGADHDQTTQYSGMYNFFRQFVTFISTEEN